MCDQFTGYHGLPNNTNFYKYLCALGFRKSNGTPRLAWNAFVDGAKAAGLP
ncbi:MAG TPA: hypothetical protein VMT34_13860 [Aggregatilineales bacterium]|nr:hypothetical protein [Aggregatilineales bacterium]